MWRVDPSSFVNLGREHADDSTSTIRGGVGTSSFCVPSSGEPISANLQTIVTSGDLSRMVWLFEHEESTSMMGTAGGDNDNVTSFPSNVPTKREESPCWQPRPRQRDRAMVSGFITDSTGIFTQL